MHATFVVHAYQWLVVNNFWKDVIQLTVATVFGYFLARLPWKKQQRQTAKNQAAIMSALDAETPGGIGDLANLLKLLPQAELAETQNEEGEHT